MPFFPSVELDGHVRCTIHTFEVSKAPYSPTERKAYVRCQPHDIQQSCTNFADLKKPDIRKHEGEEHIHEEIHMNGHHVGFALTKLTSKEKMNLGSPLMTKDLLEEHYLKKKSPTLIYLREDLKKNWL